ncbi:hypothetical protein BGZ65_007514, partial [Modicella reniformis]
RRKFGTLSKRLMTFREIDRVGRRNCMSESPGGSDETREQEKDATATAAKASNKTSKNKSKSKSKKKSSTMNDNYGPKTYS